MRVGLRAKCFDYGSPGNARHGGQPHFVKQARCAAMLLLLAAAVSLPHSMAQKIGQSVRVVQGIAQNADSLPQANAVVYLQDQKSLEVRTYITEADGRYRFGLL